MTTTAQRRWLIAAVVLLLTLWAVRLYNLNAFPPFGDETFHMDYGRDVLAGSLLDHAEEGRQFVVWWLLAFAAQTNDHFWTARAAVLLTVMIGGAAVLALGRMAAGLWGGIFAALLYGFSAYHQFFERLALADPPSAALVIAAACVAYRYRFRVRYSDAVFTGILLFLAVGAKVSALPYAIIPVLAVIAHPRPRKTALRWLAAALLPALILTGGYFALLYWRGRNPLFHLLRYGGAQDSTPMIALNNLSHNLDTLAVYAGIIAAALLLVSVGVLLIRRQWYLPLVLLVPYAVLLLGARQVSRHIIPVITLLLICGGAVLATIRIPKVIGLALIAVWGALMWLPFVTLSPIDYPVSARDRDEYIDAEAGGFGITETIAILEAQGARRVIGVLANCLTLQTLAAQRFVVDCPPINPNGEDIPALTDLLNANRDAYVVLEAVPYTPTSAPGDLIAVIDVRQPTLSIYAP